MIAEATVCYADDAQKIWRRCLEGLADPAMHFGPDVEPERVRADRFYRLSVDGALIGLGWARRFTRTGHIMSYGKAFLSEARGHGFSRAASVALCTQIFADFPDCCTLLAMIWSSNPHYRLDDPDFEINRHPNVRRVGDVLEAGPKGETLRIVQILRPEEIGAPHAHTERTP